MKLTTLSILLASLVILSYVGFAETADETYTELVKRFASLVQESQIKHDVPSDPPFGFHKMKGIFPSQVKLNFVGNPIVELARDEFEIFDNNMFVTVWTLETLLSAKRLNPSLITLTEDSLLEGLEFVTLFRDKNINRNSASSVPVYNFWSQVYENGTWSATPDNLNDLVGKGAELSGFLAQFFDDILLKAIGTDLEKITHLLKVFAVVFHIPPDLDDSGCNLALGASLYRTKSYPNARRYWSKMNSNMSGLSELVKKYAYRPFSSDPNESSIDRRTYYFGHEWIYEQQKRNLAEGHDHSLALLTTWVMNLDESRKGMAKGVSMPELINNVDISVCTNFINGILNQLVWNSDLDSNFEWFDSDFQGILLNSTSYISWAISSGRILERPDIGMLYYPSLYNFYWFSSRVSSIFEEPKMIPLMKRFPVLSQMKEMWQKTSRTHVTSQIFSLMTTEGEFVYWEGFLGLSDTTFLGGNDAHADDRVFSTSVTVNALMDAWTRPTNDSSCPLTWVKSTPFRVRLGVQRAIGFLRNAVETQKYQYQNAFFSGSVKGTSSVPQSFPANRFEFLNGTHFDHFVKGTEISCVSGVWNEKEYRKEIRKGIHGGEKIPTFDGYNQSPFPYWSSVPLTYASILASFSKFEVLIRC